MSEREKGLQIFADVYGTDAAKGLENYMATDDFGVECARWSNDFSFGTIWARDGIERKTRSAAVLAMMIALRQVDEIGYHTRMGLANGLTRREIEEILYSSVVYCGFPAANIARRAMRETLKAIDDEAAAARAESA